MIELDGSHGEGGGQMLRTALGLSVLTQKPFRITNIRKNREQPGLKPQHLSCVKTCAELSNAFVEGGKIGSEKVEFIPRAIKNRQMEASIGTAGSVTLLLQSVLLPMMFTECDIKIKGGTDVKWSMPIDYAVNVLLPVVNKFCKMEVVPEKKGYYPKGGGSINVKSKPKFRRIDFDKFEKFHQYIFGNPVLDMSKNGELMSIKGVSHASMDLQDRQVAERQARAAEISLKQRCPVNIRHEYANTDSTGSGMMLYAIYKLTDQDESQYRVGVDVLGEQRMKSEEVAKITCDKIEKYLASSSVVDECLQDNLIPILGLFGGKIKTGEITGHTKSNIYVCEKFLGVKYKIEKDNYSDANFISVLSSNIE